MERDTTQQPNVDTLRLPRKALDLLGAGSPEERGNRVANGLALLAAVQAVEQTFREVLESGGRVVISVEDSSGNEVQNSAQELRKVY